jgi:Domain of unknown function (DUF4190)
MSDERDDRDVPRVRPVYDDEYGYEPRDIGDDAGIRLLLPVGRSLWAIASGYLGLLSVLLIPAPFAVLTGILAIMEIRRNPKKHGMGRAIFGIVMGSLFSAVFLFAIVMYFAAGPVKRRW